jgi:cytochrome c-type biogenesis protein CcmH
VNRGAGLLGRPVAWGVLAVAVVVLLAVGSRHPSTPTRTERIAYLESIIKCPDCADLTIAQSSSSAAAGLRRLVVEMVDAGASDAAVEQEAVAKYDSTELLTPHGGSGAVAVVLPLAALVLGGAGVAVAIVRRRTATGGVSEDDRARVETALAAHREDR